MNTDAINWLTQAENIAHHYGKGKEHTSSEGSWMTLCPVHGDSDKPNLHVSPVKDKILLHCHACGDTRRDEIVKLVSAEFLLGSGKRKPRIATLKKADRGRWINPVPSNAPPRPNECWLSQDLGARVPDLLWGYLNENREYILFNTRFNVTNADGSVEKIYRRLALYMPKEGPEVPMWSWYGPDTALPLYGLEQLEPGWWNKSILLVEGEKAADEARKIFPEMIVLAFPGGANNYNRIDWKPLLGGKLINTVTLWPDKDSTGQTMAHGPSSISAFLFQQGVRTKVVPVFEEVDLPNKWDLADPLPEGWTRDHLMGLLSKAAFADISDVGRVTKYCGTLAKVDVDIQEFKRLSKTPCSKLAKEPKARCMQCPQFGRISTPSDVISMPNIQLDWVYMTRHKMFYNVLTHEELDAQGFNALWAAEPGFTLNGQSASSSTLLTNGQTTKVYDYGYRPGAPVIMRGHSGEPRLNRWGGFRIEPTFGVEPTEWLALLKYLILDERVREHMLDWFAFMLQKPEVKINHGLLLISEVQGVGKDSMVQPIRDIFGTNYRDISSKSLDSEFTEYLRDTKLLVISELDTIGHRRSTYDNLKPMLAGPPDTLNINIKNMKQIEIDNIVQVIAFSNKDVPIAIEDSDRRWLVYSIEHSKGMVWSPEKFQAYYAWLAGGGSEQVFGWLLERNLAHFNPSLPAPATLAKSELAKNADINMSQLADLIEAKVAPFDRDIIPGPEVVEFLSNKFRGRVRRKHLEKMVESHNAGVYQTRLRLPNGLVWAFICRHADFWMKQDNDAVRNALLQRRVDMSHRAPEQATGEMQGF